MSVHHNHLHFETPFLVPGPLAIPELERYGLTERKDFFEHHILLKGKLNSSLFYIFFIVHLHYGNVVEIAVNVYQCCNRFWKVIEFIAVGHPFGRILLLFLWNLIVNLPLICPLKIRIQRLCSLGRFFLDINNVDLIYHFVNNSYVFFLLKNSMFCVKSMWRKK